jgi:hypothetical protein
MHLNIQTKRSHGLWAKKEQASKIIDLPNLFNNYRASNIQEIKA